MWYDQSGNNRHAYAYSSDSAPTVQVSSGMTFSFSGSSGLALYAGTPIPNTNASEVVFNLSPAFNATAGNIATLFGSSATNTSLRLYSGSSNVMSTKSSTDWATGATYYVNSFMGMAVPASGQNAIDISGIAPITVDSIGFGYGCSACNFTGTISEVILYPSVLTNADVTTLIQDSFPNPPPSPLPPSPNPPPSPTPPSPPNPPPRPPSPPPYDPNCADVYDFGSGASIANGTSLQTWLGTSGGYVNMWYDLSGNNRHAYTDPNAPAPAVLFSYPNSLTVSFNGSAGLRIYSGTAIPSTMAAEVVFSVADGFNSTSGNVATLFGSSSTNTSLRLRSGQSNLLTGDWALGSSYYTNGFFNMSVPASGQNAIDISGIAPIAVDSIGIGYGCSACNFNGTISELILYPNVLTTADVTTLIQDSFPNPPPMLPPGPPPPAVTGYVDGNFEYVYSGVGEVCNTVVGGWVLASGG